MSNNRILALGDILGFSQTVLSAHAVEDIVNGPLTFLRNAVHHSLHHADWPRTNPVLPELKSNPLVGFAWFSDTVLFYGREDSQKAADAVIETVAWLCFESIHTRNANMRVGVDYGELHIDEANDVYAGRALVNAYRLEQAQRWIGGALTESALTQLSGTAVSEYTVAYHVPLRNDAQVRSKHAIRWHFAPHFDLPLSPDVRLRGSTFETEGARRSAELKWRNTDIFHEETCEICAANRRAV